MPSPLAHTAVGCLLARTVARSGTGVRLTLAFVSLSLLPDLDAVPGYLLGDLFTWHNNFSHSLAAGIAAALLIGLAAALLKSPSPARWALAALLCWWTHLAMDFFTVGRGVMLLWPFSASVFVALTALALTYSPAGATDPCDVECRSFERCEEEQEDEEQASSGHAMG